MEKRTNPRYSIPGSVIVETINNRNLQLRNYAETIDISLGGIGLSLTEPLEVGTLVKLQTNLGHSQPTLLNEARVRWNKINPQNGNISRHGFEFIDPDTASINNVLHEINIKNIELFFNKPLPVHIKDNYRDDWVAKKLDQGQIMDIIDFTPPFLKTEKIVILDTFTNGLTTQDKSIAAGVVTLEDTKGHYNDTMFLALCGWLMASTASIHLAVLAPKTVPQVIEANGVRPLLSLNNKKHIWKPTPEGTTFFIETNILRRKLKLAIVTTTITFSDVLFGVVDELKLIIDSRESIFNAIDFPQWDWNKE